MFHQDAFAGISSLQLDLPITWTAGATRGLTLEKMADVWSRRPAELAGLSARKGSIEPGMVRPYIFTRVGGGRGDDKSDWDVKAERGH